MHFPVSGVECPIWLPPAVAFLVALLTTPAGVSGAFLLLPFQVSVLGFVTPAVTPTNLIYNTVAVPGGIYRYIRERRMVWPLAWAIIGGTLPGVFLGALIRIRYLPNPRYAKVFIGFVLLYLGIRLLLEAILWGRSRSGKAPAHPLSRATVKFESRGEHFAFDPIALSAVALFVGIIGGIYGIGGGAMIAPFAMTILRLPARTVAGAALLGTLITSVAGVVFFEILGRTALSAGPAVRPDWALGLLFGAGGLFGSYFGARVQKHLPERWIRLGLGLLVTGLALGYIIAFFA